MRKVLSVFLAILLVVSCIFSVTSIPASAGPDSTDCTNNFEDETKWTIYDYSVSHVNSTAKLADSWAKILENTDSSYVYEGATSLKFACQWQVPRLCVCGRKKYRIHL